MADDTLRLRTVVVSQGAVAGFREAEAAAKHFAIEGRRTADVAAAKLAGLKDQLVNRVRRELTTATGLGTFVGTTIGGAATKIEAGTASFSKSIVQLSHASRELGMSSRDLRAWGYAAERVGISTNTMLTNLQKFSDVQNGLRYNVGGVRDELIKMGAGPIVRQMMAATNQADKLKIAFQFKEALMRDDPTGFKARKFFEQMGIGAEGVRLTYDEFAKTQAKVREHTPEEKRLAEAVQDATENLAITWERVTGKMAVVFFPKLNEDLQTLERVVDWFGKLTDKWEAFRTRPVTPGGARGRTPSVYRPPDTDERGPGRTPSLRRRRSGTTGEIIGGETNEKVGGAAGDDVLDGAEDTLEKAEEEGTFKALVRFASHQHATGGGGGLGSGPAGGGGGGGGGGAGGGSGGGGGQGGGTPTTGVGGEGATSGRIGSGHEVDQYGGLTGKQLFEPITAVMGRGLGAQSGVHGRTGHQGVDLMAPVGSSVHATQEGVITKVGKDSFGKGTITVRHPDGTYSRYLHQHTVDVRVGQNVKGGEKLGTSGYANAPHLHYELWKGEPGKRDSKAINPKSVFGWGKDRPSVGGRETTGRGPGSPAIGAPADRADKEKGEVDRLLKGRAPSAADLKKTMTPQQWNEYMGGGGDAPPEKPPGSPDPRFGGEVPFGPPNPEEDRTHQLGRGPGGLSRTETDPTIPGGIPWMNEMQRRKFLTEQGAKQRTEGTGEDPDIPRFNWMMDEVEKEIEGGKPASLRLDRLPNEIIDRANGAGREASTLDVDVQHNGTRSSVNTKRSGSDFAEPKTRQGGIGAM